MSLYISQLTHPYRNATKEINQNNDLPSALLQRKRGLIRSLRRRHHVLRSGLFPEAEELPEGGAQAEDEEDEALHKRDEGETEEDTC